VDAVEVLHGESIPDPYRWLEDQDGPETRAWIDAQNKYTHSLLDGLASRPAIQKRLSELLRVDSMGTPAEQGRRYFLSKRRPADDLSILYVRQGLNGKDEVLIDPHTLSPDHTTDIGLDDISSDGKLIVYSVRRGGQDETELHVMDVDTRKDVEQLPNALYRGVSMKKDGSGFYYNLQRRDTGIRVLYHAIGTDMSKDVEVFGKGYGPDKWVSGSVSEDGKYLLFGAHHGWAKDELYVQKLPDGPIQPIVNDIDAHFDGWFAGDRLVLQTDWQAPNQRILVVNLNNPAREKWVTIIPEGPDAIASFSLVGGKLFVSYLHNVTTQIKIFNLDGKALGEVALPGLGTATVASVRDGRTLLLTDGRELRLAAIEADDASRAALNALAAGKMLRLEKLGPEQDRYGRVVAIAYTDDAHESLQQVMLAQGQARVSGRVGNRPCAELLLKAEHTARATVRGIWADPNFAPLPSHDVTRITAVRGRFALVEGKVLSVRESGATIYVNFGRRWAQDFAVTILKRHRRDFAAAVIEPKELEGRRIRVRGWVEQRRGPMMEASVPEQIEVIR
jgi:endonuclease YncB( thermonuclease family)